MPPKCYLCGYLHLRTHPCLGTETERARYRQGYEDGWAEGVYDEKYKPQNEKDKP